MTKTFLAVLLASAAAKSVAAQPADDDAIIVTGHRDPLSLDTGSAAASRLPLTARETPATIEVLTQEEFQLRGLRTTRETFADIVGVITGNVPGNPAVVSLRGFTGNAVSILQDGVRVSTSTVVQRDTSNWHYDRIEVLKGPASVLYGEGALAGVINKVTRSPVLGERGADGLLSYGSFDTVYAAGGINIPVSAKIAARADASYQRSSSLYDVENNDTHSAGLTGSLRFAPTDSLSLLVAVDHFEDEYNATYQGLPLIPAEFARDPSDAVRSENGLVADRALRRVNYNPEGAYSDTDETTFRGRLDWAAGGGWSLGINFTAYTADRAFVLNDSQTFVLPDETFPNGSFRRTVQRFYHDHQFWNARAEVGNDGRIAGMRNRFTLGAEVNGTDFISLRQQSPDTAVGRVDIFDPQVGSFPTQDDAYTRSNVTYDSRLKQVALFAEDALNLTPEWLLLGGVRWDHIELERFSIENVSGEVDVNDPVYDPVTWRIGTTYGLTPGLTLYAQHTTAVTPVSSILLASIARTRFELTKGRAFEAGFKASGWNERFAITGAAYRIEQTDILTRDPNDPSLTVQGGQQSSQGFELSVVAIPLPAIRLSGGFAYTDARYDELFETIGGARVDRRGSRPVNVPSTTVNASALYRFDETVTLGGFLRHASGFYTDTANEIFVRGHTAVDASISWRAAPELTLTLRGRNLTDAFYGEYSGYPSTNVYIAAPRSFEAALTTRF